MKAKDLKKLLTIIPDEADMEITGPDFAGYDVCDCKIAGIKKENELFILVGFDESDYKFNDRLKAENFLAVTSNYAIYKLRQLV